MGPEGSQPICSQLLREAGILNPILQKRKLRVREVLAQDQPVGKWQSWIGNQGHPAPAPSPDPGSPGAEWGWGCALSAGLGMSLRCRLSNLRDIRSSPPPHLSADSEIADWWPLVSIWPADMTGLAHVNLNMS